MPRTDRSPVRWWPAALIAIAAAVALLAIWFAPAESRQHRVMSTLLVGLATAVLAALWLLLASRLPARTRLAWTAAGLVATALLAGSFRIRGVSGDVVPILESRWGGERTLPDVAAAAGPGSVAPGPDDYPGFLGPGRDGILPQRRFGVDWDANPPVEVWRQPIGEGWSAFAVVGSLAVTQERRGDRERVTAYDVDTGALLWSAPAGTAWDDPLGGPGPRATPTVRGGVVYALGGSGTLVALDLSTGRVRWSVDVPADAEGSPPEYGYAGSPLVFADRVVIAAGGAPGNALVAYARDDGRRLWGGGDRAAGYSSPVLAEFAGIPQVLVFDDDGLTAHDPDSGAELWHVPWHGGTEHTSQPVLVGGDRVYQSSGYGVGGKMFRVRHDGDGWTVDELWASRGIKAKFTNVVVHEGYLYGLDDGILACVDAATGDRVWKGGRYGHGQVLLAGDVLLVQSEKGFVAAVEATPGGHRELARTPALDGKTWNHPALSGRRLLVRNDREAVRLDLPPAGG